MTGDSLFKPREPFVQQEKLLLVGRTPSASKRRGRWWSWGRCL